MLVETRYVAHFSFIKQLAAKRNESPFSAFVSHFCSILSFFVNSGVFCHSHGHDLLLKLCQLSGVNQNKLMSPCSLFGNTPSVFYSMAVILKVYGESPRPKVGFGTLACNPVLDSCVAEVNTCSNH